MMREWLVIEDSGKNMVFADPVQSQRKAYIPRDVAENLLGRRLGGNRPQWFTREESQLMMAHPEYRTKPPTKAYHIKTEHPNG